MIDIIINPTNIIATNNLSLGIQISFSTWMEFLNRPALRNLAQDMKCKLIRLFDFRPPLTPCTSWNEATKTGTWNWANIDSLVNAIYSIGAEPLFCLGWARENAQNYIPSGMAINPATALPYPDSWATYCKEWVKHFKQTGQPVRFYEIFNEPWAYFGWNDYTKLANFMAVVNVAAQAMRAENPNVLLGFDGTNRKPILNYWLANGGADLGFISFHKYDTGTIGQYTDEVMLNRAETFQIETSPDYYGIQDARKTYYNARSKWILVINSESNFNSAFETGTDPKMQQMAGAVWLALMLRKGILNGMDCNIYFDYLSSKSWEIANKPSGGYGFGMVNLDDNKPWYPYYVHRIIGRNLSVGDKIVEANTTSLDIRTLAWIHNNKLVILLINKTQQQQQVTIHGQSGNFTYEKIDEMTPYDNPQLQTGIVSDLIELNGYTVMLLQKEITPTKYLFKQWQDGDTSPTKTIIV